MGTDLFLLIRKFKTQDLEKLEQLFQGHTTPNMYQRTHSNPIVLPPKRVYSRKLSRSKSVNLLIIG